MGRERSVMWAPWTGAGVEHLSLAWDERGVWADGVVIGAEEGVPFRVRYGVRCDADWSVRGVRVDSLTGGGASVGLLADGGGRWTMADGEPVSVLDGCVDVDISATPFTNTLPIRRLRLEPGESVDLAVAYIAIPQMSVENTGQRYTRLERSGAYRFESLDGSGFIAELPLDDDGLVLDYPELFRRAHTG